LSPVILSAFEDADQRMTPEIRLGETMHIRRADRPDIDVIVAFNAALAQETEQIALAPEVLQAGVTALMMNRVNGFYLLAEVDDDVVGSLMITTEWSDWRNGMFWWIQSVYVQPNYRRRGIYRALYEHVKQLAEQDPKICGFRLYVEKENEAAQETYTALGMRQTPYRIFEDLKRMDVRFCS
jgi:ribosomal protein S18 acetylase RimI-like enzyme